MNRRWIMRHRGHIRFWFGLAIVPSQNSTRYVMIQYKKPTRDNWIVESSTVFTKAQAVWWDHYVRLLWQCKWIEGDRTTGNAGQQSRHITSQLAENLLSYSLIYVAYDTINPWANNSELVMKIHATSNLRERYIRAAEYKFWSTVRRYN